MEEFEAPPICKRLKDRSNIIKLSPEGRGEGVQKKRSQFLIVDFFPVFYGKVGQS